MAYYDRDKSSIIDVQRETKVDQIIAVVTTRSVCYFLIYCTGHPLKRFIQVYEIRENCIATFSCLNWNTI